jgi:uncharacterized Zn finger protein/DNA-binding transcriptional regulator YiaG
LGQRKKIATSFWGNAWCKHLEAFSDYANRLPRGRTYVRNGSVLHLAIEPGSVKALVQGSSLYEESVTIAPLEKAKWQAIQARCQGRIGSLIELLQGRISDEIMQVVTDPVNGLFPQPSQIQLSCSCPDWASMCKHVAAVLYGIGARLDTRPELLFKLRGVDHNDLISSAAEGAVLGAEDPASRGRRRRTIASGKLNDVFGVDFEIPSESAPPVAPEEPSRSRSRSAAAKKPKREPNPTAARQRASAKGKEPSPKAKKASTFKPTPAAIRRLRTRLGLSRPEFAARLGVSAQSIANWESKSGPLKLHAANLAKLQAMSDPCR